MYENPYESPVMAEVVPCRKRFKFATVLWMILFGIVLFRAIVFGYETGIVH